MAAAAAVTRAARRSMRNLWSGIRREPEAPLGLGGSERAAGRQAERPARRRWCQ